MRNVTQTPNTTLPKKEDISSRFLFSKYTVVACLKGMRKSVESFIFVGVTIGICRRAFLTQIFSCALLHSRRKCTNLHTMLYRSASFHMKRQFLPTLILISISSLLHSVSYPSLDSNQPVVRSSFFLSFFLNAARAAESTKQEIDTLDRMMERKTTTNKKNEAAFEFPLEVCRTVREPNCSRTFRKKLEFVKFEHFS
jgi:hypothetical protein